MPKIKKENQQRAHTIYALVHDREVFVGRVQQGNHYQAYKDHINGLRAESRKFCQRCEAAGELPKMYRLADMTGTARLVYRYRLAWYSFFERHGFEVIAWPGTKDNMAELVDDALSIYEAIREQEPEEVLSEEKLLVGNYQRRGERVPKHNSITFYVKPKEYDRIKRRADKAGKSLAAFCKREVLNGKTIVVNFDEQGEITKTIEELQEGKQILRMILSAIYRNGKPYRADLENIEKIVEKIVAGEKRLSQLFVNSAKKLEKLLPK